jgi:hypothetical protein
MLSKNGDLTKVPLSESPKPVPEQTRTEKYQEKITAIEDLDEGLTEVQKMDFRLQRN